MRRPRCRPPAGGGGALRLIRPILAWARVLAPAAALLMVVTLGLLTGSAGALAAAQGELSYRCGGDRLVARMDNGAVDAIGIPNTQAGTVPGAFVVIGWRGQRVQLPRTNNAGAPSYTDGRWWWSLEDPQRPTWRHRLATETVWSCEPDD